ncbi:CocE/NonD family hydrolase [Streptomyces sp. Y1]|uniref:CocE/NonD family hydrolase n=1 Tax=Streptomyces sp. Y1 TaxID=3238634 RepID=A0AB39TQ77_9ACTN
MRVERNVEVPMRDGTILRADIFRPLSDGPCPVILLRLPYDKSVLTEPWFPSEVRYFVPRGYICVAQDVRGTYTSEGTFHPFRDETPDTVDTIEWAAGIEGSNGKVVMTGQSYLGSVQVQAAAEKPAPLVAISPVSPLLDFTDNGFRRGGAVESSFYFAWATNMAIREARRHGREEAATALATLTEDRPVDAFPPLSRSNGLHAPFDEVLQQYDAVAPWVRQLLDEAGRPEGGGYLSTRRLVPNISVPSLYVTSWYDAFLGGSLNAYAEGTSTGAAPTHLVIGPWEHAHYGAPQSIAGEIDFGPTAELDLFALLEQFFAPLTGLGPREPVPGVRYFTMGINEWRSADAWPPASTPVRLFLHSAGGPVTSGPTGTLDAIAPTDGASTAADEWTHEPKAPVPSTGGQTWAIPAGPRDQSALVERADVLAFDSEPLPSAVEVTGAVRAKAWLETDAASADVIAALVDIHPDGRRYPVTQGILRLGTESEPLHEKGPIAFDIDLWATSHVFLAGHRISVQIASSDFPHWDVNPSDGKPWPTSSAPEPAHHRLLHDAAHPSAITLPTIGPLPTPLSHTHP